MEATMKITSSTVLFLIAFSGLGSVRGSELTPVVVTNFPEVQRIDGAVSISGPLVNGSLQRVDEVVVSPVDRRAATRMDPQGAVTTDGFTSLVVSLVGEVQGSVDRKGTLGVVLVPDDAVINRALRQDGAVLFPLEASVEIPLGSPGWINAKSKSFRIAFPGYRVYLYNTSDKSIATTVYVYLTNS
jgi:hypothetical protein